MIDWLYDLSIRLDRRIMVRLVKGAYWDTEIKLAQVEGLPGFTVYGAKHHTRYQLHLLRGQVTGHVRSDLSAVCHT